MNMTENKLTPVSRPVSPILNSSSSQKGKCKMSSEKINKNLLTPCRKVGLKRKSPGDTRRHLLHAYSLEQSTSSNYENTVCKNLQSLKHTDSVPLETNSCNKSVLSDVNNSGHTSLWDANGRNVKTVRSNSKEIENGIKEVLLSNPKTSLIAHTPKIITLKMLNCLADEVKKKKNKLKHIELSKLYEKKHDIQNLKKLTEKWKVGCQNALVELHSLVREKCNDVSMSQMLAQFQIPHDLVSFHEESDEFE